MKTPIIHEKATSPFIIVLLLSLIGMSCSEATRRPVDPADGDADGDGDGDGDSDGDGDGDFDADVRSDVAVDAWVDATVDSSVDAWVDADVLGACLTGYDRNNPALRIRALNPRAPGILAMARNQIQEALDNEDILYLITINEIMGDGPVSGLLGSGEATDEPDTYRYAVGSTPTSLDMSLSGDDFTTGGDGVDLILSFSDLMFGISLDLPLREAEISGTFASDERCAIGEQLTDFPPTDWEYGGVISGVLTVEDARATPVEAMGFNVTLCAVMAHGMDIDGLMGDPMCTADQDTWSNPPETTTADGQEAWWVEADFAATGIFIVE